MSQPSPISPESDPDEEEETELVSLQWGLIATMNAAFPDVDPGRLEDVIAHIVDAVDTLSERIVAIEKKLSS